MVVELEFFNEKDFSGLIKEIISQEFLLQVAGPKYNYPLDNTQLIRTVEEAKGEKPSLIAFKAILTESKTTAGHIQLLNIDYDSLVCTISRVIVYKDFRGKGIGHDMMVSALDFAFKTLNLKCVELNVFDFNRNAFSLYKKLGFMEHEFIKEAVQFKDQKWNLIRMKLLKEDFPGDI